MSSEKLSEQLGAATFSFVINIIIELEVCKKFDEEHQDCVAAGCFALETSKTMFTTTSRYVKRLDVINM